MMPRTARRRQCSWPRAATPRWRRSPATRGPRPRRSPGGRPAKTLPRGAVSADMNAMSDATRERYLYQDCALLALAISDLTGWPCVLISEGPDDDPDVRHVLVRMPDGRLLDVDGPHGDYRDEEPWVAADWGLAEA